MRRIPVPYSRRANSEWVPSIRASIARASSRESTTGGRLGRLAFLMPSSHGSSMHRTSLYRNSRAESA